MTDRRSPAAVLRWIIAAVPLMPVIVLFGWHPRTWLETAAPGDVDVSLVLLMISVVVHLLAGLGLARIDSRVARGPGSRHPMLWRWAALGAPVYLGARLVAGDRAYRWPALVSSAVVLVGVIVAVQKLVDAAPLLG